MNPYEILGISPNATDDEVKRAYRDLIRKYHPDSYSGNPLSSLAEEKFKQVQAAYDTVMKERNGGYGAGYNSYSGGTGGSVHQDQRYMSIYSMLSNRQYGEALRQLESMSARDAQWYYYSAIANVGLGNTMRGMEHARNAASMEPNNPEYRNLLDQISFNSSRYGRVMPNSGPRRQDDAMDMCCKLWLADTLCECMGGDLCSCM